MDRHSMAKLRLDRRLIRRRNWVGQKELARALDALPDVSEKIAPPEEPEPGPDQPADAPATPGGETDTTAA